VLLVTLALADIAWGVRMLAVSRESLRTGEQFRDVQGAVPTVLVGVLLNLGLAVVALTA
jgi:hypothetical protein